MHQAPELRQSELESDSESDLYDEQSDAWSDAGLEDLEVLMELPHNRMPPGTFGMFKTSRR